MLKPVRSGQHGNAMAHGSQGPRADLGLEASGHQGLVDGWWKFPGQSAVGRAALYVIDYELEHDRFGYRQGQLDAVARRVPAGPVAQGAGVAAGRVRGCGFGQQFADRIGSLLSQLFGQC